MCAPSDSLVFISLKIQKFRFFKILRSYCDHILKFDYNIPNCISNTSKFSDTLRNKSIKDSESSLTALKHFS